MGTSGYDIVLEVKTGKMDNRFNSRISDTEGLRSPERHSSRIAGVERCSTTWETPFQNDESSRAPVFVRETYDFFSTTELLTGL
ncbi:hypothetical protein CDAR_386261 [Caerostris darwini]|uniref:Uncharacterized protein n=1 Tax=Caerostris darwini TaxID=1538125 RepID=A0AAV4SWB8_9ARAC|nr:hypothetical protein CDAR_386261 [Caerostris darwini]